MRVKHEDAALSLTCTPNHVGQEVGVSRAINYAEVTRGSAKIDGLRVDRDASLPLLLVRIEQESELEGALSNLVRLFGRLMHRLLVDVAELHE